VDSMYGELEFSLRGCARWDVVELLEKLSKQLCAFVYMVGRDRLTHVNNYMNSNLMKKVDDSHALQVSPKKSVDSAKKNKKENVDSKNNNNEKEKSDKTDTKKNDHDDDIDFEAASLFLNKNNDSNTLTTWRQFMRTPPQKLYRITVKTLPKLPERSLFFVSRMLHFLLGDAITRSHRVSIKFFCAIQDLHARMTLPVESWQMFEEMRAALVRYYPRVVSMLRLRAPSGNQNFFDSKAIASSTGLGSENQFVVKKEINENQLMQDQRENDELEVSNTMQTNFAVAQLLELVTENDLQESQERYYDRTLRQSQERGNDQTNVSHDKMKNKINKANVTSRYSPKKHETNQQSNKKSSNEKDQAQLVVVRSAGKNHHSDVAAYRVY